MHTAAGFSPVSGSDGSDYGMQQQQQQQQGTSIQAFAYKGTKASSSSKTEHKNQHQQQQPAKPKFQTLVLKVEVHCDACIRKVRKAIAQVSGVETINADAKQKRVTVTGHFDPQKVLKKVAKTGKQFELVTGKDALAAAAAAAAFKAAPNSETSNIHKQQQQQQQQAMMMMMMENNNSNKTKFIYEDQGGFTTAFSDENVNNCAII